MDPNADRPYLVLYPLQDLDFLQSPEFAGKHIVHCKEWITDWSAISNDHESLPGSKSIFDVANFDIRYVIVAGLACRS